MASRNRNRLLLLGISVLWSVHIAIAYLDICEATYGIAYCECVEYPSEQLASSYRVSCTIIQNISEYEPFWRSVGAGNSISHLKIHPRPGVVLQYVPSDALRRLNNLKLFKMEQGNLNVLKTNAVSEVENLQELVLEGNEITSMEPSAISNLPNLKKLTLSDNLLQELLADTFSGLDPLRTLYLDRNKISRIEACAFCTLQDLTELELWGNEISDLTEYTFKGLRFVTRLDLYKNKIRVLSDKVFHTMPRLDELDLRENVISYIAPRAFAGLEKLRSLALSKNNIKVLPDDVFAPLLNVRFVDLFHNDIEVIQKEVISGIKNDGHFAIGFKDNPLRCDCAWLWISSALKSGLSPTFVRELEKTTCRGENETQVLIVDYVEQTDCKSSTIKPRTPAVVRPSASSQAPVYVPLNIHKNEAKVEHSSKSFATVAVTDDETESYLRDVEERASMENAAAVSFNSRQSLCLCLLVIFYLTGSRISL